MPLVPLKKDKRVFVPFAVDKTRCGKTTRIYAGPQFVRPDGENWEDIRSVVVPKVLPGGGWGIPCCGQSLRLVPHPQDAAALQAATIKLEIAGMHFGPVLDPKKLPDSIRWEVQADPSIKRTEDGWVLGEFDGIKLGLFLHDWRQAFGEKCIVKGDNITLDLTEAKKSEGPISLDPTTVEGTAATSGWLRTRDSTGTKTWANIIDGDASPNEYVNCETMHSIGTLSGDIRQLSRAFVCFDTGSIGSVASGVFSKTPAIIYGADNMDINVYRVADYGALTHATDWPRTIGDSPNDVLVETIDGNDLTAGTANSTVLAAADINAGGNTCFCIREKNSDVDGNEPGAREDWGLRWYGTEAAAAYVPVLEIYSGVYNLYRGIGGLGNVDFDTAVETANEGSSTITATGKGHTANTTYTYALRPAYGEDLLETPDFSCKTEVAFDADGDWTGNRPAKVASLSASAIAGGKIRLRWQYATPRGGSAPTDFAVWYASSPNVATSGSPDATETYTSDGEYTEDITLTDGTTYWLAVAARSSTEAFRSAVEVGPVVAKSTAPSAPTIYTAATV